MTPIMMNLTRNAGIILLSATLLTACSKTGPAGPQGPAGAPGIAGAKGATGATGAQGPAGTANVIYSSWMRTIWALKSTSTDKIMFVPEPKVTIAFIENGGVLIGYLKAVTMGQTGMIEMPILSGNSQLVATALNNFDLSGYGGSSSSTGVLFEDYSTNFQPLTFDYTTAGDSVRYILIPGGVHARTSAPPPDYSNYEAVCQYYGIPE